MEDDEPNWRDEITQRNEALLNSLYMLVEQFTGNVPDEVGHALEKTLVRSLVKYVEQCCTLDGRLDSLAETAAETAILLLVDYGLAEIVTPIRITARWTDAGNAIRQSGW
ncbi:MAG: hypothetical protein IPK81_24265 [Rhodospirillales bacterium]|nr:MAG: hypothetical protein IPK81_24265 [Rhodospirillales bacterium]